MVSQQLCLEYVERYMQQQSRIQRSRVASVADALVALFYQRRQVKANDIVATDADSCAI